MKFEAMKPYVLELRNESKNKNTYEMKKEGWGLTNKGLQIAK